MDENQSIDENQSMESSMNSLPNKPNTPNNIVSPPNHNASTFTSMKGSMNAPNAPMESNVSGYTPSLKPLESITVPKHIGGSLYKKMAESMKPLLLFHNVTHRRSHHRRSHKK